MSDALGTPPRTSLRNTSVVFSEEEDISLSPQQNNNTLPNIVHRSSHSSDDTTASVVRFAELQDPAQLLLTPNTSAISPTLSAVPHQLPPIHTTQPSSFELGEETTNAPPLKARNGSSSSSRKATVPTHVVNSSARNKKLSSARKSAGLRITRAVSSSTPQPMSLNPLVHKNKTTVDRSSSAMEYRKPMLMSTAGGAATRTRTNSHGSVHHAITKVNSDDDDDEDDIDYVQDELGNWVPRKEKHRKTELEMRMEHNSLEAVYANHINWCKKQASYLQRQRGPDGKLVRAPTTKPVEPALGRKRCASPPTCDSSTSRMHSTMSGFMDVEFEERFDDRLQHVHERNQDDWIEEVQERRAAQMQEQLTTRQEAFQKREDRRNRIYDEIASASERKRREEIGARGAQWTHLTCIAMLFVKWKQALHTQSAYAVYRRLLLPILQLRLYSARKARARKEFIEENLPRNPRPGPDALTLTKEGFFTGWNDMELRLFLSFVKPISFRAGEHIMHAGDYDRVMYIVMTGVVEIQIKKKGKDKRRCRDNATCFPLKTPTYVGEFALLCREPRSASIQCTTDVNGWFIEYNDFEKVLKSLRPEQFDQLELATNARRTQNLINYFPSQIDTLRSYAAFSLMPMEMLKVVNSAMTPHVLQRGHVVFNEGDYDPRFYIITDGELCITTPRSDPTAPPIAIGAGEAMGIFETFFLHESRKFTATVTRNCEMWSLTRESLNDAGIIYPGVLQQCRGNIKDRLAERLAKDAFANASQLAQAAAMSASGNTNATPQRHGNNKPPSLTVDSSAYSTPFSQFSQVVPVPRVLSSDPYIRHCFSVPSIYTAWHQVATPVVMASGDLLLDRGKPVSDIYIVVSGRIRTDYPTTNGLAKYNDDVVVDPHLRGAYSLRPPPIDNLSSQFPLTPIIGLPEWRRITQRGTTDGEGNVSSAAELAAKRDKLRAAAPSATVIHIEDSTTEAGDDDLENSGLEAGMGSAKKKRAGGALHSLRSLLRGYDCDFGGLYGTSNKAELTRQSMITAKAAILLGSNELCINGGLSQKTVSCVSKCVAWKINVDRWLALTEQHPNALKDSKCQAYLASNQDSKIRSVLLTDPQYVKVHKAHLQHVADKERAAIEAAHAAHQHRTVEQSGTLLGVPHANGKSRSRGRSKPQPTGFTRTKSGLSDRSSGDPTPTAEALRNRSSIRPTRGGAHDSPTPHTAPITLLLDDGADGSGMLHPQRSTISLAVSAEFENSVSPTPSILEPITRSHTGGKGISSLSSAKPRSSSKKKQKN